MLQQEGTRFFERIGLPIGLQLYTLGEEAAHDLDATFAQVAEIGYRDVELPSLLGREPALIKRAADRAGLSISSLHLPPVPGMALSLLSEPAAIADVLGALGAEHAVLQIMVFPNDMQFQAGESVATTISKAVAAAGDSVWKRTAGLLNERGAALNALGIRLSYHNHNVEFAPIGNSSGWEILTQEVDPGLVQFEVDIGWVAAAGLKPEQFLEQLHGRVSQVHIKDIQGGGVPNFQIAMGPTEIGSGILDWAQILPAAYSAGVRRFYVEQEQPFSMPRLESIKRSYAFLSALAA